MQYRTDDLRIKEIKELTPPSHVLREFGLTDKAAKTVYDARQEIHNSEFETRRAWIGGGFSEIYAGPSR